MSYHGTDLRPSAHYLGGDMVPPRLVARVLGEYGRYGTGLGVDKIALMEAKGVEVPFMLRANTDAANLLRPIRGLIDALPITTTQKSELKSKPIDFFINMFDPIEDAVGRAVDKVIRQKGNTQQPFWLLGKRVGIMRVLPEDAKLDPSTRNLVKRMRTIHSFIVLLYTQPLEIAAAMLQEGFNIAGAVTSSLRSSLGSVGSLGAEPATGSLFAAIAAVTGPEMAVVIMSTIGGLIATAGTAASAAGLRAAAGQDIFTGENLAERAAQEREAQAKAEAAKRALELAKLESQATLRKLQHHTDSGPVPSASASSSTSASGSGMSPLLIFGGAAVLALVVLRKK